MILFNTRLHGNTARATDFCEGDSVDDAALEALITEALDVAESGGGENE